MYVLVNMETSKLILNYDMVCNEEVCIVSHEKTLFQKELEGMKPKGVNKPSLLKKNLSLTLIEMLFLRIFLCLETSDVQVNSSP